MINNLPTAWVEEFKAPFQQTTSKEWLGIFVNGSIHSWGTQKKIKAPTAFLKLLSTNNIYMKRIKLLFFE
jgi:hypothetical protein